MDGAIRFTQRDALAAVLIKGVNIVPPRDRRFSTRLDIGTAAETYTVLTVGEGLVTPSRAARLDVGRPHTTRAASESNLGEEVAVQLSRARVAGRGGRRLLALGRSLGCRSFPSLPSRRFWASPPMRIAEGVTTPAAPQEPRRPRPMR